MTLPGPGAGLLYHPSPTNQLRRGFSLKRILDFFSCPFRKTIPLIPIHRLSVTGRFRDFVM